jgi:hypothetical protein
MIQLPYSVKNRKNNIIMKNLLIKVRRLPYLVGAVGLLSLIMTQLLVLLPAAYAIMPPPPQADAANIQVSTRSITMSDSAPSTAGASYKVAFTPGQAFQEMIVDFCSDTPFIGSTCAYSPATTPVTTSVASSVGTGSSDGSGAHTVKVVGITGTAANTPFTLTLTGLTNPTTVGTFYARIVTYATGGATNYTVATTSGGTTSPGTTSQYLDYGGIALSTASVITVTAKVMESLSFCVYIATCGDTPSITLGHGTNTILDTTAVDTSGVSWSVSSNAKSGVSIAMKGATLTSGSNTIPAAGATAVAFTAGTPDFGVRISALGTGFSQADPTAYGAAAGSYGFDTSSANNVTSTYGQVIATSTAPINSSTSTLTFAATAGNTTPAGIYTSSDQLIATGTF